MKGIILERLEQECDSYVSNLRFDQNPGVLEHLAKLDLDQYDLNEWGYSLSYIFNEDLRFSSFGEIRDFLQGRS